MQCVLCMLDYSASYGAAIAVPIDYLGSLAATAVKRSSRLVGAYLLVYAVYMGWCAHA